METCLCYLTSWLSWQPLCDSTKHAIKSLWTFWTRQSKNLTNIWDLISIFHGFFSPGLIHSNFPWPIANSEVGEGLIHHCQNWALIGRSWSVYFNNLCHSVWFMDSPLRVKDRMLGWEKGNLFLLFWVIR